MMKAKYYVICDTHMDSTRNETARVEESTHPHGVVGEWWDGLNPRYANNGVVCPITQEGPMGYEAAHRLKRELRDGE